MEQKKLKDPLNHSTVITATASSPWRLSHQDTGIYRRPDYSWGTQYVGSQLML